jgi:c-di-GMP-binding flagellar brake protein YcgR
MGFATPFPEPESPDLKCHRVSARPQIVSLLRALCDRAPLVNAFVDGGPEFDLATLRGVDEAHGQIYCDVPEQRAISRLTSAVATIVGFVDTEKLQFRARGVPFEEGSRSLLLPLPESILRMARRRAERASTDLRRRPSCLLRLPDGTTRSVSVCDIAVGGLAVESAGGLAAVIRPGLRLDRCRLDLPGIGGTEVSLAIRHCTLGAGRETPLRIGCELLDPAQKVQAMVERYLCGGAGTAGRQRGAPAEREPWVDGKSDVPQSGG